MNQKAILEDEKSLGGHNVYKWFDMSWQGPAAKNILVKQLTALTWFNCIFNCKLETFYFLCTLAADLDAEKNTVSEPQDKTW